MLYYHEVKKCIEDYIREKGIEQGMLDLTLATGAALWDLRKEREKLKDEPEKDSTT